jgi:hypothetical protein
MLKTPGFPQQTQRFTNNCAPSWKSLLSQDRTAELTFIVQFGENTEVLTELTSEAMQVHPRD